MEKKYIYILAKTHQRTIAGETETDKQIGRNTDTERKGGKGKRGLEGKECKVIEK